MGRKDLHMHSLPVDHYRKQIGTQYRRRTTSEAKEERKHAELKSNTPKLYQDIRVVLSGFAGIVLLAYIIIYIWLSNRNVE